MPKINKKCETQCKKLQKLIGEKKSKEHTIKYNFQFHQKIVNAFNITYIDKKYK